MPDDDFMYYDRYLTDVPDDVMLRVLIERGYLEEADVYDAEDIARSHTITEPVLYRLVKP